MTYSSSESKILLPQGTIEFAERCAKSAINEWSSTECAQTILDHYDFDDSKTSLLDYACGPGLVSQKLSPHCYRIVGVDASSAMVEFYNRQVAFQGISPTEMIAIQKNSLEDTEEELDGEMFDVAICTRAYHHIADLHGVTMSLARRLKPGGSLIVIDLERGINVSPVHVRNTESKDSPHSTKHIGGFSKQELANILKGTGRFESVDVNISHTTTKKDIAQIRGQTPISVQDHTCEPASTSPTIVHLVAIGIRAQADQGP